VKKGEHVYVSGKLRYREYEKAVGEGKNTVTVSPARYSTLINNIGTA